MEKFDDVPVEEDTIIKHSEVISIGGFDSLYQRWVWEGITAESLIFMETDVEDISDQGLVDIVNDAGMLKGDKATTIVRNSNGYTFLNMNFENPM